MMNGKKNFGKLPDEVEMYIAEIAEKMKLGKAVVMVGAGFSKNAKQVRYTTKKFLQWNELGDIFYKKIYGKKPSEEDNPTYYHNVMKLASMVEECFGRSVLNEILINSLPDEEYEPGILHKKLLQLNWADIFTTNYDTLLERTRKYVYNRRYKVILTKEDLVYTKGPRIIKLHGSFPSTKPFVITEEDYQRYPRESAVFVNTVQQDLIENLMCMVGFSGDDPNFLNWIDWIRENLGKSVSSKIYLIGVFNPSPAELTLLNSRNIIMVNLKECVEENDYEGGLTLFLDELLRRQENEEEIQLQTVNTGNINEAIVAGKKLLHRLENAQGENSTILTEKFKKCVDCVVTEWKGIRESYLGWFIMPWRMREQIAKSRLLEDILLRYIEKIGLEELIIPYLREYNWRLDKRLSTLSKESANVYEGVIGRAKEKVFEYSLEKQMTVLSLGITLLAYYRETFMTDKWKGLINELSCMMDNIEMPGEMKIKLYCEQAYGALYNLDFRTLTELLQNWPNERTNPESHFIQAGLLVELGRFEQALEVLNSTLNEIRNGMGIESDYRSYSLEAYCINSLNNIESYFRHINYVKKTKKNLREKPTISYHLKTLRIYDCDPLQELSYFNNKIPKYEERNLLFLNSGNNQINPIEMNDLAEQYIHFLERTGSVFRNSILFDGRNTCMVAIYQLSRTKPKMSLICSTRFETANLIHKIWTPAIFSNVSKEVADCYIRFCIESFEQNKYFIEEYSSYNSLVTKIPSVVPTVIKAFLPRSTYEIKKKVLDFIVSLFPKTEIESLEKELLFLSLMQNFLSNEIEKGFQEMLNYPLKTNENLLSDTLEDPAIEGTLYYVGCCENITVNPDFIDELNNVYEKEDAYKENAAGRLLAISLQTKNSKIAEKVFKGQGVINTWQVKTLLNHYKACFDEFSESEMEKVQEEWKGKIKGIISAGEKLNFGSCERILLYLIRLLAEIKFYKEYTEIKLTWTSQDIIDIFTSVKVWLKECVQSYYDSYCGDLKLSIVYDYLMIEALLLTMLHEVKIDQEIQSLAEDIKNTCNLLDFPNLLYSNFTDIINMNIEEIQNSIVSGLYNNKESQIEVGIIILFYTCQSKKKDEWLDFSKKMLDYIKQKEPIAKWFLSIVERYFVIG